MFPVRFRPHEVTTNQHEGAIFFQGAKFDRRVESFQVGIAKQQFLADLKRGHGRTLEQRDR